MICAGIKDVENRTWKPAEVPGRILIHASSKKVTKNFNDTIPEIWESQITDHQIFDNIPEYSDMPTSAIIGYVTVTSFVEESDSIWDGGSDAIKWNLEDAWLFDEPIMDVKGKLNLFDYPLDENNLPPAHKVELRKLEMDGDNVLMPIQDSLIDELESAEEKILGIYFAENLTGSICKDVDKYELVPIKTITFLGREKQAKYELDQQETGFVAVPDIDDETKPYLVTYLDGTVLPWMTIQFFMGKKL
jgi:hypothetical protein